jgi:peptide deformylase
VKAFDKNGEQREFHAEGWYARILQHEVDHLNGTLYIDQMVGKYLAVIRKAAEV